MKSIKIQNHALSVRQPFAEQIISGKRKLNIDKVTNIRGRVYIYASKTPKLEAYEKMKIRPGTFPVGVLIGTVEIVDCKESQGVSLDTCQPKRLKTLIAPEGHPQPMWFKPFKE
ncbi:hypothetical protein [Candidatus Villigracilis affinis]|uniref:hypothetical protein n=1 Tax=Candidatus Villigracilis affinis TaxID=3140682 RepID=UPI002A1EDFB6|nr:ASCH domain-containing protein [Anaerolineales bacterium]